MIRVFESRGGFALPTILIASMIMLTVLIASVSATSGVRTSLDNQYYQQLAREAAESGLARANGCLQDSGYASSWSDPGLYPNTSCNGGNPCTNTASCFVTSRSNLRTTFYVSEPENLNVSQIIRSIGKVELLRGSTGEVWRTYTYAASARVSVDLSLSTVAFGYIVNGSNRGSYFATIAADGKVRAAGYNAFGQLGTGGYSSPLTPTAVQLNSNERAVSIYTNFLSQGLNMFILTASGKLYGSGANGYGQLGDGSFTTRNTPVEFSLPTGKVAKHVGINGFATYVITTDGNVYSTGMCDRGLLGYNYTISGCTNRSSWNRVALPTPNASDLNTIPTNNIVSDSTSTYIRMQGGRVYGWGGNDYGQLATGNKTHSAVPVQMGSFGDSGQAKAVQVETDGISVWIVDDAGRVWGAGDNTYGETGGGNITMELDSLSECVDNTSSNGVDVQFWPCNTSGAQKWTWRLDKSIYNAATGKCLNVAANNETVNLATCNSSNSQKWTFRNDRTIHNTAANKCLNNRQNDGVSIMVYTCSTSSNNLFDLPDVTSLSQVILPSGAGNVIKVATDQWFTVVMTSTGDVYGWGINHRGQLGNGATATYQPAPVKLILPSGITAKDIYVSAALASDAAARNNTFVVGSDGKVYGTGANDQGQLGDGTTTVRSTPVAMQVINGTSIRASQVITGWGTTVVVTEDKKVFTVGSNDYGQLGDGTTTNSLTPKANRYTNVLPLTSF